MTVAAIDRTLLARPDWGAEEAERVALIADFVQLVMNDHDYDEARRRFANSSYVQHNRNIPDGMEGLLQNLVDLTKRFPEFSYDVKHAYVDGDRVIFHSHATMRAKHRGNDRQGLNIVDVWRVVDGQIVEHWDAIQPLAFSMRLYNLVTGGRLRNQNGPF